MSNIHFSERFKSARILNGFSLQDLADKLGNRVTRQALHKYEKGEVTPDSEMMGYLCEALNLRPDFFQRPNNIELGEISFRKLQKLPAKENSRLVEYTKDVVSRYIEIEEILGIETSFDRSLSKNEINTKADIEEIAIALRTKKWNLGSDPISNVIELLEANHIKVVEVESEDSFDGMSTFVNGAIPIIVLNTSKLKSLDRKRFTALHELGHLVLNIKHLPDKTQESFCHYFAAAMLFPREAAERELGKHRSKLLLPELGLLKQQYGISIQAMIYRLRDLGIITDSYLKQLYFYINQQGYKVNEPYAYSGNEGSHRFIQLIFRALAEDLISMSKAAALNNQKLAEFRNKLTAIE